MPVYFIESSQIEGSFIRIREPLAHHLRDVLRVKTGETLEVVDERRRRYRVTVDDISRDHLRAAILSIEETSRESGARIQLAQAVLKRSKMEWLIQKATELGVRGLVPLLTERTVVHSPEDRSGRQRDRWRRIATEAAQQCGRNDIPEVESPCPFREFVESDRTADLRLVLWEGENRTDLRTAVSGERPIASILLVVGPEGGFSDEEIEKARQKDYRPVSLGGRILRAETAALAAISILQYEFGGLAR